MSVVLLCRLQFALAIGFHFLFPPTTLALTLAIVILEILAARRHASERQRVRDLSRFLVRLLGLVFVLGTATGIVMEFSFGTNWARYSRFVGDIFGAPLAAEAVFAFFLESVFLGVLVFGRERISARAFRWSAGLVFLGAHLSAFWIVAANSWMQTPAGFTIEAGRARLSDFYAALFNPSTLIRFLHTVLASWITGSLLLLAIAAWYLLRERQAEAARILFRLALSIFAAASLLQLGSGHIHSRQVAHTQPEKMAAFEALWKTQARAPLTLFCIPDEEREENHFYLGVSGMLSFLIYGEAQSTVAGLNSVPRADRPPVLLSYTMYHLMFFIGFWFIGLALWGIYLALKRRFFSSRFYLKLLFFSVPLGYVACEAGWIAAEVGRQPWAVYRVLRTAAAASSSLAAGQVLATLILFALLYVFIFIVFVKVLLKIIRQGPEQAASGY